MVSLTQEKQLAAASAQLSNGLKPGEVSALTEEEKAWAIIFKSLF